MSKILLRSTLALIVAFALAAAPAVAAPDPSFTVAPDPPTVGVPATLTSTSTPSPLTEITTVEWDFEGDGTFVAGGSVEYTFAAPGAQTFTMRVTDSGLPLLNQTTEQMSIVVNAPPTATFVVRPDRVYANEEARFNSTAADPEGGELDFNWDFGDASGPSQERNPRHTFAEAGTKTVRLVVTDPAGGLAEAIQEVVVWDPGSPTADFSFAPQSPTPGQRVTLTSSAAPSAGQTITALNWDLDNDGQFDDADGEEASRAFSAPGLYRIALRVRQSNGKRATAEKTVRVGTLAEAPPTGDGTTRPGGGPPASGPDKGPVARPSLISPFPVVRLKGEAYRRRTVVKRLGVRAPRGSVAAVRCKGRGCPKATRRKRSKGKPVRFKAFERSIGTGARIEVFVRKRGRVGKYVRFKLRSRDWPLRIDGCLAPGRKKPRPCPS